MIGRAILEAVVALVLTVVLAVFGAALLEYSDGSTLGAAFLDAGPRLIFGTYWWPLALWALLLVIGNIRNRRRASGWAYLTNQVSALIIVALGVCGWLLFALLFGGWAWFVVGIALVAGAFVFAATIPSLLLTHFAFFRHAAVAVEQPQHTGS